MTAEDARLLPLVSGRGKGARLMATMGVSRALGDFDLVHRATQISIKPFVSPHPEVVVWRAYRHLERDAKGSHHIKDVMLRRMERQPYDEASDVC